MSTAAETLSRVLELYERGLYLQAHEAGRPLGPLPAWTGTDGRIMAGRLAPHLGAPKLGGVLLHLAWRNDRSHPQACYYRGTMHFARFGPLPAWRVLRAGGDLPAAAPELRAEWFGLHAEVLAALRDFHRAEQWMARAEKTSPRDPFLWVQRSMMLELQDRVDEALDAARHSLALQPWFRPAVESAAHLLIQLNRDDEAIALLREAAQRLECGVVLWRLTALLSELRRFPEAREVCENIAPLHPLMEKAVARRLAAARADIAYHCGDLEAASRWAAQVDEPFFKNIKQRLAEGADGRRVVLPVTFVRQHYKTCSPATLAALSRFWSKPAEHPEVAEAICYGGTPSHRERRWAEQNGFLAREFRVTWDAAVALVDRGVPFAMGICGADWGHIQAVIGYDSRLRTLLIRDPNERHWGEYVADAFFEEHRFSGPRGLALVPREKAGLVEGLDLPEADLYDLLHEIQRSLEDHRRDCAQRALDRMDQTAPDHRLTIEGHARLAYYDSDPAGALVSADRLLAMFPDAGPFLLMKLGCLQELARRQDRLDLLRHACARKNIEPAFWQRCAEHLLDDAREHREAEYWLRRAIRTRPPSGNPYRLLANILWDRRQREEALELYRFAACLEDTDEECAKVYFVASRHLRHIDVALGWLKDRFRRFGRQSGWPARTLCWAYGELERVSEAFAVLDRALALRPEDGQLQLFAADVHASYGDYEKAGRWMQSARSSSHPNAWLRSAAHLALCRGELQEALGYWKRVAEAEPIARDAHVMVAQLLSDVEGRAAAIDHLRAAAGRFPHNYALRTLLIEWLREEHPDEWIAAVRGLIEIHPVDPWAHRELAMALAFAGDLEQAMSQAEDARRLEPSHPGAYLILGLIERRRGNDDEARRAYREAIRISVDHEASITGLMDLCQTKQDRRESLIFIYEELVRQVIFGDGLLSFREHAAATLEPEALLDILREALELRPDLWHAHAALVRQLAEMGRTDEALERGRQAVERFPLLPRLWIDLARVRRERDEPDGEIEALERALELSPGWPEAAQTLGEAYDRRGELAKAKRVMQRAVARQPGNAVNRGYLADMLWKLGQREAAVEHLKQAVGLQPGYDWAWSMLRRWAAELGEPDLPIALARKLTGQRPYDPRSWLVLADALEAPEHRDECMRAVDRALALWPRSVPAHMMRAYYLAEDGKFDEALAACRPDVFADDPPMPLRVREAEIEARRGNLEAAVARMQAVLDDDPDLPQAWLRLAEWYDEDGQVDKYLEAAEHLVRIDPRNPVHWGHLGSARLRRGDRAAAREALRQAVRIAPAYGYAAATLVEMHLDDREADAAAETLALVEPHMAQDFSAEYHVRLAALRGDEDAIAEHLRTLCAHPGEQGASLRRAVSVLSDSHYGGLAERVLSEQTALPEADPAVGAAWVQAVAARRDWQRCLKRLQDVSGSGEMWFRAAAELMIALGKAEQKRRLQKFIRKYRSLLVSNAGAWASAGEALVHANLYRRAADWMDDWESRSIERSSVLFYLVLSLWELRREDEAERVGLRAVQLPPDGSTPYHWVWLAVGAALRSDWEELSRRMAEVRAESFNDYYQFLHQSLQVLAAAGPPGQRAAYRGAARELAGLRSRYATLLKAEPTLARLSWRFRQRLAAEHGRRLRAAWFRLQALELRL